MILEMQTIGNLGADATIKDFNGKKFIAFNLGCSEKFTNCDGVQTERTTWVSCLKAIRNEQSTLVGFLRKGTQVYVRGRVSSRAFARQDGTMDSALNLNIFDLQLLSSSKQASAATDTNQSTQSTTQQPQNGAAQTLQQAQAMMQSAGFTPMGEDDDLPF